MDFINHTSILISDAVAGFSVSFIWRGTGTPGAQSFDAFAAADPFGPPILNGMTQLLAPPNAVPEPGTGLLALLGLFALIARRTQSATTKLG